LEPVLAPICLKQSPLGHYRQLLALAEGAPFDDEALRTIQQRLCERGATASAAMDRLEKLIGLAAVRHNALIYILADVFALWDVWCAFLIDRWRAAHGARVATWLEALAELEALVSLATFAHEHPEHAWPVLTDGPPRFVASALGHPLIDPEQRVANDVALTDDHPALMITGSNMSGKSTMLRSIGINAVLAQAGAPVCAQSLEMTPLAVHTSMRAHDDLDRGASRFFAEVAKLQRTVAALEATRATDPTLLFLLDEVLHGTNSRERNIGAKAVVRYLVDRGAIGAVSSHDLGLVELSKLTDGRVVNVHFEDHIADDKMCFDYRMKPGPVSTSNALRLMRMVGIDVPGLDP
jgi:DNA mismatch repair ATPase MutS